MGSYTLGSVSRAEVEDRLLKYVRIHSVNPGIDGGPGEIELANELESDLHELGIETTRLPVAAGGRDNIIGRLGGAEGYPSVMFEAHLDTVGLSGVANTEARSERGLVFGRGACDTKGSLVSMLEALRLLTAVDADQRPTIVMVGTIDEEYAGTGAEALVQRPGAADMAVVGEPTSLHVGIAHKGVLRFEIATGGTPAHSSKPHLGVNAIINMAPVLTRLEEVYRPSLRAIEHPLVGSPTINVSTIRGGTAQNIVPAECVISIDRRVNPGESHASVLEDIDAVLEPLREQGVLVERGEPTLATAALDTPADHPLVVALCSGREKVLGKRGLPIGMTFGSDASFFGPAGIPSVIFGPGSIDQAHSDDEWVEIEEVARGAEVLAEAMLMLV
jgi:succinyl-diaminopimelate desuccinylase